MNVYDFDKTIYDGDSTLDFYKFCLKRHPSIVLLLPGQIFTAVLYKANAIGKNKFKEYFFGFLQKVPDIDEEVFRFWNEHDAKIKNWYKKNKQNSDIIVSASPEFLLKEICNRMGIKHVVATQIDKKTGKLTGNNCYGEEKVNRLKKYMPGIKIHCFYSDSYSDTPVARISEKAFLVKGDQIVQWVK